MAPHALRLSPVQAARKVSLVFALLMLVAILTFTGAYPAHPQTHEVVEYIGRLGLVICILGRCWCTLYIGGRKIRELVTLGPYSVCRNPLYSFSFLGAFGVGAQSGSILIATGCAVVTYAVFRLVVGREERVMRTLYPDAYAGYFSSTPRFLPNLARWRDAEVIEVRPGRLLLTLIDGLVFLLAIPLAEVLEYFQGTGAIPILWSLP